MSVLTTAHRSRSVLRCNRLCNYMYSDQSDQHKLRCFDKVSWNTLEFMKQENTVRNLMGKEKNVSELQDKYHVYPTESSSSFQ